MATKETEVQNPRKITIKTVCGKIDFEDVQKAGVLPLMDVYGVATRAKPGSTDLGAFVAFLGQFRATNLRTKERFESAKIILPKFLEESLYGALPEEGGQVQFAFRLSAKYNKDVATKYEYQAKSLIKPAESDILAALEGQVTEAVKALPAPRS